MRTTKIVLIGAGSVSFGLGTVQNIIAHAEALRGSQIVLVDIDADSLDLMLQVALLIRQITTLLRF